MYSRGQGQHENEKKKKKKEKATCRDEHKGKRDFPKLFFPQPSKEKREGATVVARSGFPVPRLITKSVMVSYSVA